MQLSVIKQEPVITLTLSPYELHILLHCVGNTSPYTLRTESDFQLHSSTDLDNIYAALLQGVQDAN